MSAEEIRRGSQSSPSTESLFDHIPFVREKIPAVTDLEGLQADSPARPEAEKERLQTELLVVQDFPGFDRLPPRFQIADVGVDGAAVPAAFASRKGVRRRTEAQIGDMVPVFAVVSRFPAGAGEVGDLVVGISVLFQKLPPY